MASPLPVWLDHYLSVPSWVMLRAMPGHRILWVNERLAEDNGRDRDWFVGKSIDEVWPETHAWLHYDVQAIAEGGSVDTIVDGHTLNGVFHWLDVRRTRIDRERLLVVAHDVTAAIRLAALRLVLGKGISGSSKARVNEGFARQLLEGASLDALSDTQSMQRGEVLANLALLVADQCHPRSFVPAVPMIENAPSPSEGIPDCVRYYWDLPVPAGLLEYPSMRIRWVNRLILENNRMEMDAVVGRQAGEIWRDSAAWKPVIEKAMNGNTSLSSIQGGYNLRGEQHWIILHCTPMGSDAVLLMGEDITARIRVQALRLLLGMRNSGEEGAGAIDDAFARLMLDGASVANLCAALQLSESEALSQLGAILG
jgi:hypothetical protein